MRVGPFQNLEKIEGLDVDRVVREWNRDERLSLDVQKDSLVDREIGCLPFAVSR